MKKLLLPLLLIGSSVCAATYDELVQNFKYQLYKCQEKLMPNKKKYYKIIDRFLQKAESNIKAITFCKKFPDSELTRRYLDALRRYNVGIFNVQYAGISTQRHLDCCKYDVREVLALINKAEAMPTFSVDFELSKTLELIEDANAEYYKQLSGWHKALLGFNRTFAKK